MERLTLASLVIATLTGCVGDGGFHVTGSVRSSANAPLSDCQLRLSGNVAPADYYTREFIPPDISDTFLVGLSSETYLLTVSCSGHRPFQISVDYGQSVSPSKPLELGAITLQAIANGT